MGTAENDNRLGTEPIGKLLLSLAIPAVMAQLVNLLYNIVDRIFVGRIPGAGTQALAGLGVTFPIVVLGAAFANLAGMGGAPRAAIAMGQKDNKKAEKIMGNSLTLLLIFSAILMVFFYIWKEPILLQFGASKNTLPYADDYLSIYLLGTVFVQISLGLNTFITNQGFAKVSMATVCIGAVINIVLDPIFIFGFHMGVKGAALATVISQAVSAIWVLCFLTGKKTALRLHWKNLKPDIRMMLNIVSLGIAPFIMTSTECLIQLIFNSGMLRYGDDDYVAVMSILFSLNQVLSMPMQGFAMGAQPIISYNYGAKTYDRAKKTFHITFMIMFFGTLAAVAGMELFPAAFVSVFTKDAVLLEKGVPVLRLFMAGMALMGAQWAGQQTFLALGKAGFSVSMALLRKLVLLIPLALILPHVAGLGLWGLILAEPISDAIAATTTAVILKLNSKRFWQPDAA